MKNQSKMFRRNKSKDVLFFMGFLVFVALGYSLLEKDPMMAWLGISFFGLGAVIFLIQLLTNSSYLKLNEDGFEAKSLLRTKKYKWSDVENFKQDSSFGNKRILFDYTDEFNKWNSHKKQINFLAGKQESIVSCYNIKTEELLSLMNDYKLKSK